MILLRTTPYFAGSRKMLFGRGPLVTSGGGGGKVARPDPVALGTRSPPPLVMVLAVILVAEKRGDFVIIFGLALELLLDEEEKWTRQRPK